MASKSLYGTAGTAWNTVATLVAADGAATHRVPRGLTGSAVAMRDLADAVHALCSLHGRHPGMIDHALHRSGDAGGHAWLAEVAAAFTGERAHLARLTAAAGPLPSTPGQAESETAVAGQRHALDMLAQSARAGCAAGAVVALVLDWTAIRALLDSAARRFGVEPPASTLPGEAETAALVQAIAATPAAERAMGFGAHQLLAQHRGLWDLLEARASARDHL